MKLWIKRSLVGLFGASIVVGGLTACANRHHGYTMAASEEDAAKFKARIVERAGKALDLNEQQRQRLTVLGDRMREQRLALVGNTADPRAEVRAPVVSVASEGRLLKLAVRDFGPGVEEDQLAHLAEPFYRTDKARQRSTGGVGLGLYLARLVAQAHGGSLVLRNTHPGLEVTMVLPLMPVKVV